MEGRKYVEHPLKQVALNGINSYSSEISL